MAVRVRRCYHIRPRQSSEFEGATITPTRLASCGRECPRGSVVSSDFRQLLGRFGEISRFSECERPDLSDWPTTVTAGNRRSRRPEVFARAQGTRATRAEPWTTCDRSATREVSLRSTCRLRGKYTFDCLAFVAPSRNY